MALSYIVVLPRLLRLYTTQAIQQMANSSTTVVPPAMAAIMIIVIIDNPSLSLSPAMPAFVIHFIFVEIKL